MSRETRIGVIAGLLFIIAIGIVLQDFAEQQQSADTELLAAPPSPPADAPADTAAQNPSEIAQAQESAQATPEDENIPPRIRVLLGQMQSESANTRAAAAAAAGFYPQAADNMRVLTMLKRMGKDADCGVRTEAAIAMTRLIRAEDHGATVSAMLGDSNWSRANLYVHVAYLSHDDPHYAVHLLPGLVSAVPAERDAARDMVRGMAENVSDVYWTLAREDSDLGTRFGAIHGLVIMGDNALAMLDEKLDGSDKNLALQILDEIADDGEIRDVDEWHDWIGNRLAGPEEDDSDESFLPDAPMTA